MSTRRLLSLGAGAVVLLAVTGVASHGRPLAGRRGQGPTASFFDYFATTLLIVLALMVAIFFYALWSQRLDADPRGRRGRWHLLSSLIALATGVLLAFFVLHSHFEQRLRAAEQRHQATQPGTRHLPPEPLGKHVRNPRIRWDEIAVVLALLGGTAVVLYAGRHRRRPLRQLPPRREQAVASALDESIDDLRNDPDLRRAIVAAYARMEQALAAGGLPRRPAEAPFEYVERALRSLDTSAAAAHRLTGLFEWAKFSHHAPEPEMRDEAIDALLAVRDELRRPAAA